MNFLHQIKAAVMSDSFTNTTAIFAVISPLWLEWLQDISQVAALLLPVAGLAWLVIQAWSKIFRNS